MTILFSIVSFVVALGILVTIHEFGHFWVARLCGVKVLRFSVGFGKPLYTFNRKNDPTDYVLAGIPLGGYVKMLDENEGDVADDEKQYAFNNKPLLSRVAIVLAGPVFNLVFAFIAFWVILTMGEEGLKPVVGNVAKAGIASHAGMEVGDEVVSVNNRPATIWRVAIGLISSELLDSGQASVSVIKSDGRQSTVLLSTAEGGMPEPNEIAGRIGLDPQLPQLNPVMGEVVSGEAADQAGMMVNDQVIAVNGQPIEKWEDWATFTRSNPDIALNVDVLRKDRLVQMTVTPKAIIENEVTIGRVGVRPLIDESLIKQHYAIYSLDVVPAISEAFKQTISYSVLTVKLIGRMLMGEASVKNLSGPISLAQYAVQTTSFIVVAFFKVLAIVIVSSGVLHLLPITMLDGGHLFF